MCEMLDEDTINFGIFPSFVDGKMWSCLENNLLEDI